MKVINTTPSVIEVRVISYQSPNEEYKEFYKFLLENCIKDEQNVRSKELEYLIETYSELVSKLEEKSSSNENYIKLLRLCSKSASKLKKYIEKGKKEYGLYNSTPEIDKEYKYYNNLSSWYSIKKDLIEKIVDNLDKETNEFINTEKNKLKMKKIKSNSEISYLKWSDQQWII